MNNQYNAVKQSKAGKNNNYKGHNAESEVKQILESKGLIVMMPLNPNNSGYDLIVHNNKIIYLAQVKTDVDGNNKYPIMSEESKKIICSQAYDLGCVPIQVCHSEVFRPSMSINKFFL